MSKLKHNYIAGKWCTGESELPNINPSDTSDVIGLFAQASKEQLGQALQSARVAQQQWATYGIRHKYKVLMAIGDEILSRSDELGILLSREEGKPLVDGIGEIVRAANFYHYYAAECLRQMGDYADSVREGVEVVVMREPVGVVGIISPWNFPTATASWKIAPALAYGNAIVWKPANITPASAVALTEIIVKQDIPDGLFNLVMGSGSKIGQALVESRGIDAISFTGSVPVGKEIASHAVANGIKIQMEMGSKNALVVMDDADIDTAIAVSVEGAFGCTGQKCTASSRLVVHHSIHDEFVEKLLAATKKLKVGNALDKTTQVGPVVSLEQLNENLQYVDLGKKEGADLIYGGQRLPLENEGFYMSPGIFVNSHNKMKINREEMFAPLTAVIKVSSYDEALAIVNDTNFGLSSGIVTTSLKHATHFRRNVHTGCVMVNLPTAGTDYHVPFGGRGDSSYGPREQGQYAAEFYTSIKTTYIKA